MHTLIYYFSGTGNSLATARQLARLLEGTVDIQPMRTNHSGSSHALSPDRIGFVFPVYFQSIPEVVKTFVHSLPIQSSPYIFAVATCNGVPGHTLFTLAKTLRRHHQTLSAGFSLDMPGNSLIVVDYMNPPEVQHERLARAGDRLKEIAATIQSKQIGIVEGDDSLKSHLESLRNATFVRFFYRTSTRFRVSSVCTRCGACARICPASNIHFDEKTGPQWGADCHSCLACFHWCPQTAIDLRQKQSTKGKSRYHHPEVGMADIING